MRYALDRKKDIFRRRSDNKKFYIREILDYDEESGADETKSATEESDATDENPIKSKQMNPKQIVSDVDEDKISNFDFESDSEPEAEIVFESDSEPESEPMIRTILDHPQNQNPNQIENKLYQYILSFLHYLFCSLALFILFCYFDFFI